MFEMWIAIRVVLCIIAIESIVELVTDSQLLKPIRRWIKKKYVRSTAIVKTGFYFPYWWVKCGYCCSYIVTFCVVLMVDLKVQIAESYWLNLAFQTAILGRLSNWLHDLLQVWLRGRVKYVDVTNHTVVDGDTNDVSPEPL